MVAPLAVKTVEPPLQIEVFGDTVRASGVTVTVTVPVALHDPLVPVTVYVVVALGLALTLAPVEADNPVGGDQE